MGCDKWRVVATLQPIDFNSLQWTQWMRRTDRSVGPEYTGNYRHYRIALTAGPQLLLCFSFSLLVDSLLLLTFSSSPSLLSVLSRCFTIVNPTLSLANIALLLWCVSSHPPESLSGHLSMANLPCRQIDNKQITVSQQSVIFLFDLPLSLEFPSYISCFDLRVVSYFKPVSVRLML